MKANLIVGKKQIILASLVLVLGVAVYLNWSFAKSNEEFEATGLLMDGTPNTDTVLSDTDGEALTPEIIGTINGEDTKAEATGGEVATETGGEATIDEASGAADLNETGTPKETDAEKVKHLGDAQLVSARVIMDENYFVKAKLARSRSRDESIQTLSTILDDEKLTEADKKTATEKAITITDIIEAESKIENLVKAKGFEECMVYISNGNATVVVKTPSLDQEGATQIKNIVVTEGLVKGENVSITEIN